MDIYIYNLAFILFWGLFFSIYKGENKKRYLVFFISFQLFALSGLRSIYLGTDLPGYLSVFNWSSNADIQTLINHRHEIGYLL